MGFRKMQFRLAFREEGKFWNAYIARADTMDGAKLIGSIVMGPIRRDPNLKEAFMDLMKKILSDAVEDITGEAPTRFDIEPAPEAERSGHS